MQENIPEEHNDLQQPATGGFLRNLNPFAYVIIVLGVIFFLYQIVGGAVSIAVGAGIDDINNFANLIIAINNCSDTSRRFEPNTN